MAVDGYRVVLLVVVWVSQKDYEGGDVMVKCSWVDRVDVEGVVEVSSSSSIGLIFGIW